MRTYRDTIVALEDMVPAQERAGNVPQALVDALLIREQKLVGEGLARVDMVRLKGQMDIGK